ncbi:MAG TPA: AIR synthase-related protein, partial [Chloroflexota bacterium]
QARGAPPWIDLDAEKRLHQVCLTAAQERVLRSAHDVADGGLAVAVAESAILGQHGADVGLEPSPARPEAQLFGEGQSRAVVSVAPEQLARVLDAAASAGVRAQRIGRVGGGRVRFGDWIDLSLEEVAEAWEQGLELAAAELPS